MKANLLTSRRRRARSFVDDVLLYRGTPPADAARIGEFAREQTFRVVKPLLLAASSVGLLWWPLDFVLYRDQPAVLHAFALWRSAMLVYCLGYYLVCDRWAILRRHYVALGTLLGAGIAFLVAAALGSLGSLDRFWFGSLCLVPIMSIPFFIPLGPRLIGTTLVALGAFAGYFGLWPHNVAHPDVGTAIGLLVFGVGVSTCAGHALYHLFRIGYLRSVEVAERTRDLETLSATLSERFEARTAELRLLAAHVEDLRESERSTLARDLHDELGQLLTGMRVELDVAEHVRARSGDTRPQFERMVELLDATLAATRNLLAHLRPRILDDFGLSAALDWLCADIGRRSGLTVEFRSQPEEIQVAPDVATGLFRIVQESLTNVVRHARAREVRVDLTLEGAGTPVASGGTGEKVSASGPLERNGRGEAPPSLPLRCLTATVADDGVGLPPISERRLVSLGLVGMRERATALGGTFEIESSPGAGTRVTVHVPAHRAILMEAP